MKRDFFDVGIPFVAGGVVFMLAAYGTGLVTATNAARADVANARIDERASICQEAALSFLSESAQQASNPVALAEQFAVGTGDPTTDRMVRQACSDKLRAA